MGILNKAFAWCERCGKKRWGKRSREYETENVESTNFDCSHCGHITNNIHFKKAKKSRFAAHF